MFDVKFKMDLTGLEKLSREFPEISKEVRISKVTEALMLLEREVKKRTPWGAGPIHLRDTIHNKVNMEGRSVKGILGTPLQHGEPVEHGTKAHFPPLEPLQFWVEKKLFISDKKEAKAVAFLIGRKIAKHGTKGAKMFEEAFDDNKGNLERILASIPAEIIRRTEGIS